MVMPKTRSVDLGCLTNIVKTELARFSPLASLRAFALTNDVRLFHRGAQPEADEAQERGHDRTRAASPSCPGLPWTG